MYSWAEMSQQHISRHLQTLTRDACRSAQRDEDRNRFYNEISCLASCGVFSLELSGWTSGTGCEVAGCCHVDGCFDTLFWVTYERTSKDVLGASPHAQPALTSPRHRSFSSLWDEEWTLRKKTKIRAVLGCFHRQSATHQVLPT